MLGLSFWAFWALNCFNLFFWIGMIIHNLGTCLVIRNSFFACELSKNDIFINLLGQCLIILILICLLEGNFNLDFLVLDKQSLWRTVESETIIKLLSYSFDLIFLWGFFQYDVPPNMILYNSLFDFFYRFWLKASFGSIWLFLLECHHFLLAGW